jgi:5-methyltetrahydropteroyltriglutamate--homocysteine methyltransferase
VVEWQRKTGIDVISDGELRKVGFSKYVLQRMSGFEGHADFMAADFADAPGVVQDVSVAEVARGAPNWPPSACGDQAA